MSEPDIGLTVMPSEKSDRRRCRTCGESYEYPSRGSLATRSCCERCAQIPPLVRRVLDRMRRRLDRMAEQIEKLAKES